MKQVFIHGPGDVRIDEVPEPDAGPRDAIVKVAACGICGSDLRYVRLGGLAGPMPQPMPLGHELDDLRWARRIRRRGRGRGGRRLFCGVLLRRGALRCIRAAAGQNRSGQAQDHERNEVAVSNSTHGVSMNDREQKF